MFRNILTFGDGYSSYSQEKTADLQRTIFDLIVPIIDLGLTHDTELLRFFDGSVAGLADKG